MVGFVFVDRGSDEVDEEVKKMPWIEALRSPFLVLGASIFGGLLAARLTRRRVKQIDGPSAVDKSGKEASVPRSQAASNQASGFSLSHFLGDHLRELGSVASGMAVSLAIESLGIPSVKQLLEEILGDEETQGAGKPTTDGERAIRQRHPLRDVIRL